MGGFAGGVAGGAAGAAAVAIAEATKASGVIVRVNADDWLTIVDQNDEPIVVHAHGGFFRKHHQYLTSYRGLAFFAKSDVPLELPEHCQVVEAKSIWVPG